MSQKEEGPSGLIPSSDYINQMVCFAEKDYQPVPRMSKPLFVGNEKEEKTHLE